MEVLLSIPSGALPGDVQISITLMDIGELSNPPIGASTLSRGIVFGPDGTTFSTPVFATISYSDVEVIGINEAEIDVITYDESIGAWVQANIVARDLGANTITFSVSHFTDEHTACHTPDCDLDGCTNAQELGDDEQLGGRRQIDNPYDFYDVFGGGQTLPKDRLIDLPNDILAVIQHFSPSGAPPYDVRFDRGPSAGPNVWNMTAPDGVIDLANDILGVILQFSHNCQNP